VHLGKHLFGDYFYCLLSTGEVPFGTTNDRLSRGVGGRLTSQTGVGGGGGREKKRKKSGALALFLDSSDGDNSSDDTNELPPVSFHIPTPPPPK